MNLRRLAKHLKWHVRMNTDLHRSGLPHGLFFRTYCYARLRAYLLGPEAAAVVRPFVVRHGVSGQQATLHIRTDLALSDWVTFRGIWAHHDYLHPLIGRSRTILDAGANVGFAAVWFKTLIPEAELACVEPDPRNIPLMRLNLAVNNISAKIFECAVASCAGLTRLGIEEFQGKSSLEQTGLYKHQQFVEVKTRPIPEILDDLGWQHVDLLKMDIEGMEHDVLAHGGDWLDRVGLIVLEVHQNTSAGELRRLLQAHGWTLQRLGTHDEETYIASRNGY
jgi:FkbM family methyltransferase